MSVLIRTAAKSLGKGSQEVRDGGGTGGFDVLPRQADQLLSDRWLVANICAGDPDDIERIADAVGERRRDPVPDAPRRLALRLCRGNLGGLGGSLFLCHRERAVVDEVEFEIAVRQQPL